MNNRINQLLEKYWDAETTLQEEAELRQYFSGEQVAPEHKSYQPLFNSFSVHREMSTDLDVEQLLSDLEAEEPKQQGFRFIDLFRSNVMGLAAVFVALFTMVTVLNIEIPENDSHQYGSNVVVLDTEDETEEAMQVTKEALAFLSSKLNSSNKIISKSIKPVEKAQVFK